MDPSSAVLPRRKISARSPATSVDQVWSKAGARRRLYDSGTAWSAEDFTDRGGDIWVKAKTNPKPTDRPEQQSEKEPVANERLSADPLQSVSNSPGTGNQGAKGKSLTLDRGSAVKLKSGAKEERSSFLNWLWTLFRSKRKDAKDESAPCSSKTQEGASASNETALRTEEKPSVKGEKVLGEAARAVLTGSDFRLIDDEGGDVYEDACDGGILPDAALNQGQDDVAINPEIAKRLEDIDEVLKAVYERNIAYGRSVSMQRLGVSPGYKYQGDSREGSREADGDKSSSHLSLSRVGERTALLTEGDTSHKCHEKKISVGSSSPSSYYSHSRSESELTNDDEFLALGAPPPPPKVKPSQAGYMRLSEPNFSNAECARFKVGRFLQQSNDEQWFGHSDQSLEGRQTGHHEAVSNTDDTNSATVLGERSAAVEDKLLSLTSTFDEGVRAIRKDIEQCLASTQQFSPSEASAAFISEERNNSRILRRSTPHTLLVTEEVEENDRDLSGFTDDGLDDILKISSNTDVEADEWEGFDPAAWSRSRGFVMPADSACYTSILPSGKQLVDVRQGEVEGAARDESWADIQRALQQLVDSQDSALLQELKKAPEDETPLEPVSEETDLTKTEDVSLPETSLMFADTTSAISHPVSSTQLSQSEDDSPQTYLTKGNDIVCPDATRSPATVGDIGIPHPFESMQEVQSQDDLRHHLDEETVTAPKDPKHDLNSEKGKQDPQTETQPMLQSQFQEVPPVIGQSVVSPVTKESLAPDNIESFFDEAFDRPELPVQPAKQPMADVSCLSQGGGESLQGNLHTVSAVNVFTLSDETLNNLRSAAQNIKKSAAVDLMTPSEELVDAKLETPEGPSVDVLEEFHVSQGRIETPLDTIQDIIINKVPQKPLDAQNRASSSLQKLLPGSFSTGCTDELRKEADICSDIVSLTEPVTSDSQDSACSQLRNVALQYSNLQESLISLRSKEKDSRDKADSMSLDSLINHDIPKFHQVEKEHSLLGNQQQQYQSVPDVTKTSEAVQRENSLLESADFSDEPYTTKAIDEFLGVDLSEKKEINIPATEEKTAISEKAVTDQPGNLTWTDTASESFYQFGEDWAEPLPFELIPLESDPKRKRPKEMRIPEVEKAMLQQFGSTLYGSSAHPLPIQATSQGLDQKPPPQLQLQMPVLHHPAIKREPAESVTTPGASPYMFAGAQSPMFVGAVSASASPSHSVGRTPSPMDYVMPQQQQPQQQPPPPPQQQPPPPHQHHHHQQQQQQQNYQMEAKLQEILAAGRLQPAQFPSQAHSVQHPVQAPIQVPQQRIADVASGAAGGTELLDLDSQQLSLGNIDSGDLTTFGMFCNSLSENLSSNLNLTDGAGAAANTEAASGTNMTDSLTRLANTTIQDICSLNSMYKGTGH